MKKNVKKTAAKKTVIKKTAPKKRPAPAERVGEIKEAYRKAIDIIVKANEVSVDGMDDDSVYEALDGLKECRQILSGTKRDKVISNLLKSLTGTTVVEIDEAADTD